MLRKLLLCLLPVLLFFSCRHEENSKTNKKFTILATTGIIGDAVKNIVGDSAIVSTLMGPGVDPHLYKVSQGDLSKLMNADLILYNGLHLEGKMGEVLANLKKQKVTIAVAEGLPKNKLRNVSGFSGTYDPHIWFNVDIWKQAVHYIGQQIAQNDSSNASYYLNRLQEYENELDALNEWVGQQIATIPEEQRVLITAHDAFGYFGEAYDIQVEGLQGISTISEPGLKDISEITSLIVKRRIKAIFVESSVSQKTVKSVVEGAREKGQQVEIGGTLYSDALGEEKTPAGTYVGMVKENVNTITKALKGD